MKREQRYPETSTFHLHNANPKGRITGDCRIRALTEVTGIPYNQIVMDLAKLQIETGYDQTAHQGISILMERYGWTKHKQPRKPDNTKYTAKEFCKVIQKGVPKDGIVIRDKIFCNCGGNHETAIINGKVWDIWNCTEGCIGNYWTKEG